MTTGSINNSSSDMAAREAVTKLPKLTGAEDFISWKRRVKAYIQQNDINLTGLKEASQDGTTAQQPRWYEEDIKAKSIIALTISDSLLA